MDTQTQTLPPVHIRACHSQVGLAIEARQGDGEWVTVQLHRYAERRNPSRPYSTYISPAEDEAEYFATLDARGVKYIKVRGE